MLMFILAAVYLGASARAQAREITRSTRFRGVIRARESAHPTAGDLEPRGVHVERRARARGAWSDSASSPWRSRVSASTPYAPRAFTAA